MYFGRLSLLLQNEYRDKEILTSIQFSFLKTRLFCFLHKLFLLLFIHVFVQSSDVSVQLFSVHLLLLFLLLFLLWAIFCQMSSLFTVETFSFFHQCGSFVERHCVNVHSVRVFPFWKNESSIRSTSSSFLRTIRCPSCDLLHPFPRMIESSGPFVPIFEGFGRFLEGQDSSLERNGKGFAEKVNDSSRFCSKFRF